MAKYCSVIYVNKCESLGFFVWTKRGIERFGLFDENFWPAYREDWDMKARFKTQTPPDHFCIVNDLSFPVKHDKPFPCSKSYHKTLEKIWQVDNGYFKRKWGDVDDWHSWYSGGPKFKTPFGNPDLKISDWTLDSDVRAKREAIWVRMVQPHEHTLLNENLPHRQRSTRRRRYRIHPARWHPQRHWHY